LQKVSNEINAVVVNDSVIGKIFLKALVLELDQREPSVMSDLMDIIRGTYNYPVGRTNRKRKRS